MSDTPDLADPSALQRDEAARLQARRRRDEAPEVEVEGVITPELSPRLDRDEEEARDADKAAARRSRIAAERGDGESRPVSFEKGDVPEAVSRRYYTDKAGLAGRELGFFTDAQTKDVAFRDAGAALMTRKMEPDVVRDMVAVAAHRGWTAINVRGTEEFKRAVWLESQRLGLDVHGYKATERDRQERDRGLDGQAPAAERGPAGGEARRGAAPERTREHASEAKPERVDFDKGFEGRLRATGTAPYQDRPGAEPSPYLDIELANGKMQRVWGATLPERLDKSGGGIGDMIAVRRNGKEPVLKTVEVRDKATGETTLQQRTVLRNSWQIDAERFKTATPAEAARDPKLRGAQSQLAVVAAVVKDRVADPKDQNRIIEGARARIVERMMGGRTFGLASIREPKAADKAPEKTPEKSAGKAPTPARSAEPADRGERRSPPERARGR